MRGRLSTVLLASLCAVAAFASCACAAASAATSSRTDVLLLIDTSGSMEDALGSAVADVKQIAERARSELGDIEFAVAEVRDYPIAAFSDFGSGDRPYRIVQPMTADTAELTNSLFSLIAGGGGDAPEAYGRALRDADDGAGLGWRAGAKRMVILVADDMPHDDDLNWGIPEAIQIAPSPYGTLRDPGNDEIVGTGDDIDWQGQLGQLAEHGLPLMYVLFEGNEEYLPYWQTWAGWTGGSAVDADTANLTDVVIEQIKRGATAKLPYCPAGQSRDEARRCRPFWDWLGYSFRNGNLPEWAQIDGLSREDVLTEAVLSRVFGDTPTPFWWDMISPPTTASAQELWDGMERGVCYGMALSGGRFSTGLEAQLWPDEGRPAGSWAASPTPKLEGPTTAADPAYRQQLLQTIAGDHVGQAGVKPLASVMEQQRAFAAAAAAGNAAAAERSQLESIMTTGRAQIGGGELASERGNGTALVGIFAPWAGHALLAYEVRDGSGGAFQIEVWDNNRPNEASTIDVASDGSWSYGPLGWSGGPGSIVFMPEYPPRGLGFRSGGLGAGGNEVMVADVSADAKHLKASAHNGNGSKADVSIVPEITDGSDAHTAYVVTRGSELDLSLEEKHAGALVRGSGLVLYATGLTGKSDGKAKMSYDIASGQVAAKGPKPGTLAVLRGDRRVSSRGAAKLTFTAKGSVLARAEGGRLSLVFSSDDGGRLNSTRLGLKVAKNSMVEIPGKIAKHLLRHGGTVGVKVRRGKKRRLVRATARTAAERYGLRARLRIKHRKAKVSVSSLRRLPKSATAWVAWKVSRHGKVLLRRRVEIAHLRAKHRIAGIRLPKGKLGGVTVKVTVHALVGAPGPAALAASASHRIRRKSHPKRPDKHKHKHKQQQKHKHKHKQGGSHHGRSHSG